MALMASMSATWPYRPTGMMAIVRGVILASIRRASMLQVSGSMSTYTGTPPRSTIISAVAAKVKGVVMTSSPGFRSRAISAINKASVPLATVMQCFAPVRSASAASSSLTSGPMMYWPWSSTRCMRSPMRSFNAAYWVLRSMNSSLPFMGVPRWQACTRRHAKDSVRRWPGTPLRRAPNRQTTGVRHGGSSSPPGAPARPSSTRNRARRG